MRKKQRNKKDRNNNNIIREVKKYMKNNIKLNMKPEMVTSVNKQIEKYNLKKSVNQKPKESVIYKSPRKCSTKSQWQWKWENEYEEMKRKYKDKKKNIKIKDHKAVILFDGETYDAYGYR